MGRGPDINEINLLMDAFETFKEASATLEGSYNDLELRVEELDIELAEKNNFLTSVLEGLPVGVIVTDTDGIIRSMNNPAYSIFDVTGGEVKGRGLSEFLVSSGLSAEVALGVLSPGGAPEAESLLKGKKKKTLTVTATVLSDLQGADSGRLIVIKDVSDIKRLEENARRDRRLMAMGEMAASIAHQIRNPLGSIELFASILNDELKADADNRAHAQDIIQSVRSLNNTLSNMLLFANTSTTRKTLVDTEDLIGDLRGVVEHIASSRGVAIEMENGAPGEVAEIDRELIRQVLVNLIINGIDAASGREDARVRLRVAHGDDGDDGPKDSLMLVVSDNGAGIEPDNIDKVFDPFYTSKAKGTGLGLTVVNSIVKSHGGFVDVESDAKSGTAFTVTLPREL